MNLQITVKHGETDRVILFSDVKRYSRWNNIKGFIHQVLYGVNHKRIIHYDDTSEKTYICCSGCRGNHSSLRKLVIITDLFCNGNGKGNEINVTTTERP